jgi:hypothetical protein
MRMSEDQVDLQALERDLAAAVSARLEQQQGGAPSCYTDVELTELEHLATRLRQQRPGGPGGTGRPDTPPRSPA